MSRKLSDSAIRILKSTAPTLSTEGTKVTSRMYEIMFSKYPIVKNLFNASHFQKVGNSKTVAPQVCFVKSLLVNELFWPNSSPNPNPNHYDF